MRWKPSKAPAEGGISLLVQGVRMVLPPVFALEFVGSLDVSQGPSGPSPLAVVLSDTQIVEMATFAWM